jgi:exodeoxyribonuclease V alpha subunit
MSEKIDENAVETEVQKEFYELIISPTYKMFYSEDSSFGIFGAEFSKETEDSHHIKLNGYGNFTIKGNMPLLEADKKYVVKVRSEMAIDKQGRESYEVVSSYESMPSSKEETQEFLKAILTEKQVEEIFKVYPDNDVVELIADGKFDYNKVKGLGDVTYENVKKKVLENIQYREAIAKLSSYGVTHKMIVKMSDQYGSPTLLVQKVESNPYILSYEVDGIGFKKADLIATNLGVEPDSQERIGACILYSLDQQANEGHSWISRNKLAAHVAKELGLRMRHITDYLEKMIEESVFTEINKRLHIDESRVALEKNYRAEKAVARHIKRLLEVEDNYHITNIESRIDEAELEQGFEFTDEQREAIRLAVKKNVIIINGKAGTGKTSVLKGILKVMTGQNDLTYATCALSGKASQRIQESTGLLSSTMHRLLAYNPQVGFQRNEDDPLEQDVIVLDEASMVNSYLMSKLVCAVKDGAKLIILGDTAQLEPIGVGNCLLDMINSGTVPRVELTIVHRQAQRSGILSIANQIREGIQFAKRNVYKSQRLGELKDLLFYPYDNSDDVYNKVLEMAEKYNEGILDFQVIVPLKERGQLSTRSLNKALQEIFNPDEIGKPSLVRGKGDFQVQFREGDKVIQNGNNYDVNVFNGTIGIIEYVDMAKKIMVINFEGVGRIEYGVEQLNKIDLAYALSIHRTQGSQWKYVVVAMDYSSYKLLSRQILYTAITRAEKFCFFPCELNALLHAVDTDKSTIRNTFLVEILK